MARPGRLRLASKAGAATPIGPSAALCEGPSSALGHLLPRVAREIGKGSGLLRLAGGPRASIVGDTQERQGPPPGQALRQMTYDTLFSDAIGALRREGRYREFADLRRICGRFPRAMYFSGAGAREVTVWCSNDYLAMGQHRAVLDAMHEALDTAGCGSGGTRNISGTTHYHVELEAELAGLHGKPAALLFNSGYMANAATLATIARLMPDCVVLSDEKNHASMIEGIRHSRCDKQVWRHNDLADLEARLGPSTAPGPRSSRSNRCTRWMATLPPSARSAAWRGNTMR
jgi:hypothetical protein